MLRSESTVTEKHLSPLRGLLAFSTFAALLFLVVSPAWSGSAPQTGKLRDAEIKRVLHPENQRGSRTIAVFKVETVSTPEDTEKGLAGREGMPKDRGMLFVLDEGPRNFFWMKGMKFPIDILFFSRGGKLLGVLHRLEVCQECPLFKAPEDARYALEINAGLAKKFGVRPGDSLVVSGGKPGKD